MTQKITHLCLHLNHNFSTGFKLNFSQFVLGLKVVEARISSKGADKLLDSNQRVPNFGFVVFEDERSVTECMNDKPIKLDGGHRINVEIKKNKVFYYF